MSYFDRALAIYPQQQQQETWNNKGIAFYKLGEYKQAIATFDVALKANVNIYGQTLYSYPDASMTDYNKALALLRLGQHDHDISDIHLALKTVDEALHYNSDYKRAQDLRMTLKDILAWDNGPGGDGEG